MKKFSLKIILLILALTCLQAKDKLEMQISSNSRGKPNALIFTSFSDKPVNIYKISLNKGSCFYRGKDPIYAYGKKIYGWNSLDINLNDKKISNDVYNYPNKRAYMSSIGRIPSLDEISKEFDIIIVNKNDYISLDKFGSTKEVLLSEGLMNGGDACGYNTNKILQVDIKTNIGDFTFKNY